MNQYQQFFMVISHDTINKWKFKAIGPFTEEKTALAYARFIEELSRHFRTYKICMIYKKHYPINIWGAPLTYAGPSLSETPDARPGMYGPPHIDDGGSRHGTAAPGPSATTSTPAGYPAPTESEIHGD
jgi:hypothetical protein